MLFVWQTLPQVELHSFEGRKAVVKQCTVTLVGLIVTLKCLSA